MAQGGNRRKTVGYCNTNQRPPNRPRSSVLSDHLLREMARNVFMHLNWDNNPDVVLSSNQVINTDWIFGFDRAFDTSDSEPQEIESVATMPLTRIRSNNTAWALFMRGFQLGSYMMQIANDPLQDPQELEQSAQFRVPQPNQTPEEAPMPSLLEELLNETDTEWDLDSDTPDLLESEPSSSTSILSQVGEHSIETEVPVIVIESDDENAPYPEWEDAPETQAEPESMEEAQSRSTEEAQSRSTEEIQSGRRRRPSLGRRKKPSLRRRRRFNRGEGGGPV
ncbi:uncharacterized protein LOC112599525 [Melanaphis sacchari]|uniref:uncharacterized protein LOC112599525 n=1 Tax=Melanaphis sacchari TaxID=742174 RepID=UPI000DC148F5|nr:uncharacterized protein LOC112599525 [Melanaphis sacchari]